MTLAPVADALGDAVALVIAGAGRTIETVIAALRATATDEHDSVVLLIPGDLLPLDRALLRAAIGPLAIELAPARRLNAVDVAPGAALDDVTAAARFLAAAESTTGQVIEVR